MHNKKRWIPGFLFIGILLVIIHTAGMVLYPMNDIMYNWHAFYHLKKQSVNTLVVGSSHAYATFDTNVIEKSTGKQAFILASNSQNMEQTYFNVKEALHYQKPALIILEAYSINGSNNYRESKYDDKNWKKESNIDGMHFGIVKLQAIATQYYFRDWLYALFPIARSHGNWKDISQIYDNCNYYLQGTDGYLSFRPSKTIMSKSTMEQYEAAKKETREFTVSETNEIHFHKLAKLCRKNDIRLVVVMAPMYDVYIKSINYESKTQKIAALAKSENVPYLDCNLYYEEMGMTAQDFEDVYSTYHHLNAAGAEKATAFILKELDLLCE